MFSWVYAQEKGGQKLHIVAQFADDSVSSETLCGKKVSHWRMTSTFPMRHCCKNCARVDRLNGQNRLNEIIRKVLRANGY